MPPAKRGSVVPDATLVGSEPQDVGEACANAIATKGYCVLNPGLEGEALAKCIKDAAVLEKAGRLRRLPTLVVESLLGTEGSSQVAQLTGEDSSGSKLAFPGDGFATLDDTIDTVSSYLSPFLGFSLNIEVYSRTHSLLHEAGEATGEAPALNESEASNWMFQLSRAAIVVLVALGPDSGTIRLSPYEAEDGEDADYSFEFTPGTMLFVRNDLVSVRHVCPGRGLVVSSFLLSNSAGADRQLQASELPPAARKLNEWAMEHLDELKNSEVEGERLDVPRDWIIAMNRQCFRGQHIAVRGLAARVPVTWDEHEFYASTLAGVDYLTDVPLMRWDHSSVYNEHPEGWRYGATYTRHMSFIDGAELFDNKIFGLTPAECRIMDPQQRLVLENGYEALLKGGYKKGQIMNSTGGMYLGFGTGTSDFNFMQKSNDSSAEGSFGATGGSAAICANRFNFCLGMRGPSIAIDAEDAGSSVAVHLGCEGLQRRGRLTVNSFSVVGGVKLNLSPYYWPQRQAMGVASKTGRCMTFDASCDGMVLGDSVTNLTLNALTEVLDNEVVVKDYAEMVGVIAGTATNHNGRSANFFAPNGPAEQEVISMSLRGAQLSGFDIDASECYGYGGFLADAVEVSSVVRILRLADEHDEPLGLTSIKSCVGNVNWAAGALSFVRILMSNTFGCMTPNLHLREVNPHIDVSDQPMLIPTESLEYKMRSSYTHTMSRGFGGTNSSLIGFNNMDFERRRPPPPPARDRSSFWPGGRPDTQPKQLTSG
mmetsp:Transcript_60235/g.127594  ORF Transcript_60235/g.127594 Transcript_60235/m.127594 type:complete len:765 (-) Transcript_60235:140-2434(-)